MEIKKEDIARIRTAFERMQTREDLLSLLNEAKPILYGKRTVLFELKQITWYSNPRLNARRYTEFKIKKRSGGERSIHAPVKGLKAIQRTLAFVLQCVFEPHQAAKGFAQGRSILSNAQPHVGQRYVYNIDLKDFFPSVDQARVWKCLQLKPFNLNNVSGGTPQRLELANLVAALCCTEMDVERKDELGEWVVVKKNVLPQGAPTSPVLTNVVCVRLDYLLTAVAKRFGLRYTRYADDISFSSMHNVYREDHGFIRELHRIIADQRFHIKETKTRLHKEYGRQEVTGLKVNEKVNVRKGYDKELRMWLYYWERYGYGRATDLFLKQMAAGENGKVKKLEAVLDGKLNFLRMIKGSDDQQYSRLAQRYEHLVKRDLVSEERNIPNDVSDGTRVSSKPLPHDPIYTIKFLKNFKTGDGSGFKELVHDTELTPEIVKEILNKVKSDPNFVYHYKHEWVRNISFLNGRLQGDVKRLIDSFEKNGVPFFNSTGKHPYGNDYDYTNYARQFKRNYRYGRSGEYSNFMEDILGIFREQGIPEHNLVLLPDARTFNLRSSFFTWKPSLLAGIRHCVQGIKDHLNINGNPMADLTDKRISLQLTKVGREDVSYTEFQIMDELSRASVNRNDLWEYLTCSKVYTYEFRNLCDWIVECDLDEGPAARLNLLTAKSVHPALNDIQILEHPVNGYKNILRFYDVK